MNVYKKENMDIQQAVALEIARAENAKLQANLDYVAMMTDVEIPEEEQEAANGTFTEI